MALFSPGAAFLQSVVSIEKNRTATDISYACLRTEVFYNWAGGTNGHVYDYNEGGREGNSVTGPDT